MTTAPAPAKAEEVFHAALPLERIEPSTTNPRKHIDETKLQELADTIRARGVLEPILVRPHPSVANAYELVAGERRYRASILAGRDTIPAIERNYSKEDLVEIQIIENLQREDVHELDEANGYQALIDHHGYTAKTIGERIGKSKEYVYGRLKLAGAIPEIQKLFYARELTAGHVVQIARLPAVSQKVVLEKGLYETVSQGDAKEDVVVSVRDLDGFIKEQIHTDLEKAPFDRADKSLLAAAGSCVECPKKFGSTCQDRACYHQKVNAWIDREVKAGRAITATTDYQKEKQHPYWYYLQHVNAGSCPHIQTAICIDGPLRSEMKLVCRQQDCKVHHRPVPASRDRSASQPSREKQFKERRQKAEQERAYRVALYQSVEKQIDRYFAAVKGNPLPIAKVPLAIIAARLMEHVDYQLEQEMLKEFGIKAGPGALEKQIAAHVKTLPEKQLAAFVVKTALRTETFVNEYEKDVAAGAENLHVAAEFYKIDAGKLRAQVLAQKNAKAKVQTRTKGKKGKGQ